VNLSLTSRGIKFSISHLENLKTAQTGKLFSEVTRRKMSASHGGVSIKLFSRRRKAFACPLRTRGSLVFLKTFLRYLLVLTTLGLLLISLMLGFFHSKTKVGWIVRLIFAIGAENNSANRRLLEDLRDFFGGGRINLSINQLYYRVQDLTTLLRVRDHFHYTHYSLLNQSILKYGIKY
jgi:hypothetical protein